MREAPSLDIAQRLAAEGAHVKGYDPVAMDVAAKLMPGVHLCEDPYELAAQCDAVIIVTEWNEFKQVDLPRMKSVMRKPVVVDGRNIYDPDRMNDLGFIYRGIGRGYSNTGLAASLADAQVR
ncbi:MAG: hypothetical protein HZB53_09860 [Chloroflexi bacterium]|nr:hypothetical protein [Chloroflexota bacterium]